MAGRNRRRKKLIRLDLQLKIVFITLFVASLVLLINFQLSLAELWSLEEQFSSKYDVDRLLEVIKTATIQKFLFSVAMAVPLAGFVGVLYSFKFCGPIYKFKKYFTELATERWDDRCMLRRGDDLQDVCQAINDGVGAFRDRVRKSHAVLEDVEHFLGEAAFTVDGKTQALLDRIRTGLEEERTEFDARFGGTEPMPTATPQTTSAESESTETVTDEHVEETDREAETA